MRASCELAHGGLLARALAVFALLLAAWPAAAFRPGGASVRRGLVASARVGPASVSVPVSGANKRPTTAAITPSAASAPQQQSLRVQRLKDIALQKEVLKDITAAEFALKVEIKNGESTIDYDRLVFALDARQELMEQRGVQSSEAKSLLERLARTREGLLETKRASGPGKQLQQQQQLQLTTPEDATSSPVSPASPTSAAAKLSQAVADNERLKEIQESLRVIVREDGTVDWDGAKETGKEVARFGAELWERLNGKESEEGLPSIAEMFGQVQAKEPETEGVLALRATVQSARGTLDAVLRSRDELRASLRESRRAGSGLKASDVQTLRRLDARVKDLEKRLRIYTLDLDIERVCVYLQKELEGALEPLDLKVFVAEVGLLDKQLAGIVAGLELGGDFGETAGAASAAAVAAASAAGTGAGSGAATDSSSSSPPSQALTLNSVLEADDRRLAGLTLVDEDELSLIVAEVADLKNRLGLDTAGARQMDWGSLGKLASEGANKIKVGLSFYGDGTKLLFTDIQYAGTLLAKAVSGSTLKPREVNTVRRTGKDLLTLIPFTIILIIPLSPVGHVLVFSFIQKYFPELYPSCYTDKRMNLRRLYQQIAKSSSSSSSTLSSSSSASSSSYGVAGAGGGEDWGWAGGELDLGEDPSAGAWSWPALPTPAQAQAQLEGAGAWLRGVLGQGQSQVQSQGQGGESEDSDDNSRGG